jgi:hypothetical protein
LFISALILVSLACEALLPTPTATSLPTTTSTLTLPPTATQTLTPSPTLDPTQTPDLAATQHAEQLSAEVQKYYDRGYLKTTNGEFIEYEEFQREWAQIGWYGRWSFRTEASDFFMSGHFTWSSASHSADPSGCGFFFAGQDTSEYAVLLEQSQVLFLQTNYYYSPIMPTRGTGRVKLESLADQPWEADFAVIVKGFYAYVVVNGEVVGEYSLSKSKDPHGELGVALLSGTNKDYGTRCKFSNLHLWLPDE